MYVCHTQVQKEEREAPQAFQGQPGHSLQEDLQWTEPQESWLAAALRMATPENLLGWIASQLQQAHVGHKE